MYSFAGDIRTSQHSTCFLNENKFKKKLQTKINKIKRNIVLWHLWNENAVRK